MSGLTEGATPGRVIWDGAEATGMAFGVKHIPVVKHQAMPAYDPRPVQGIGVTYATSTMGADHTAGYTITANILAVGGTVDPHVAGGPGRAVEEPADRHGDARRLGFCIFVAFPVLDIPEAFVAIHEMTEAHTGEKWDADELMQLGREVLTMERMYNTAPDSRPQTTGCPSSSTPRSSRRTTSYSPFRTPSSTPSSTSCPRRPKRWACSSCIRARSAPSRDGADLARVVSMVVHLALFAYLSEYQPDGAGGRQARPVELAAGMTIADVIGRLGLPDEPRIVFVNGRHAPEEQALTDGDRLAIFPPVAGG